MPRVWCILLALGACAGFRLAIAGANGGLGRELVYQSLERGWHLVPLVRNTSLPIKRPFRSGWLSDGRAQAAMDVPTAEYGAAHEYDAIVLSLSGRPFEASVIAGVTRRLLDELPTSCTSVCLVSAHGVGDSIESANAGIRLMRSWYLRSLYAEKEEQEAMVRALERARPGLRVSILRPKVLSFGAIPFIADATPREVLARQILDWASQ